MYHKIAIIGPESTGKSTLCQQLAQHYQTLWCPEYAREYLLQNGKDYTYDDLLTIAKKQMELEDEFELKYKNQRLKTKDPIPNSQFLIPNPQFLFIDTELYVMKVWCEYVFGKCHQFILNEIVNRKYDLFLLCNIDLEWTADELREYPTEKPRKELFNIYKDILINQNTPWALISGKENERLQNAVTVIDNI